MKQRLLWSTLLLAGVFLFYVSLSDGPARVHVMTALVWVPVLLGTATLAWVEGVKPWIRGLSVATAVVVGGLAMAYGSSIVIGKAGLDASAWAVSSLLLLTGLGVLTVVTKFLVAGSFDD
jgi:hypothetical protein